jgi:hypothetical protein
LKNETRPLLTGLPDGKGPNVTPRKEDRGFSFRTHLPPSTSVVRLRRSEGHQRPADRITLEPHMGSGSLSHKDLKRHQRAGHTSGPPPRPSAGDELSLTHEFMSMMLGVARPGAGSRGQSSHPGRARPDHVLDRAGLEALAGDAYGRARGRIQDRDGRGMMVLELLPLDIAEAIAAAYVHEEALRGRAKPVSRARPTNARARGL